MFSVVPLKLHSTCGSHGAKWSSVELSEDTAAMQRLQSNTKHTQSTTLTKVVL